MAQLPTDDHMFDDDEMEGLVRIDNSHIYESRRHRTSRSSKAASFIGSLARNHRMRWCCCLALTALVFVILFTADEKEVGVVEGTGGANVVDTEKKNTTIAKPEEKKPKEPDNKGTLIVVDEDKDKNETPPPVVESNTDGKTAENSPPVDHEKPAEKEKPPPAEETEADGNKTTVNPPLIVEEKPASENKPGLLAGVEIPQLDDKTKQELAAKWGKWEFVDAQETKRPKEDYCASYPYRDIPRAKFPKDAWQTDPAYVQNFLNQASALVTRTMEAILDEYGHGKTAAANEPFEERSKMFQLDIKNFTAGDRPGPGPGEGENGGWTTRRSFDGLVRRILHALMTNDSFTFVMGGHSAAAGHGNNFKQSYMMQFHEVMAPVFERLGVKLASRNMGQGGLGTIQAAMGAGSIYGGEMDMIAWDSGMTENRMPHHVDLFMRQSLIGGNRVPVLWGGQGNTFQILHENADVDVGSFGAGLLGIPEVTDAAQANKLPYAARYLKCNQEAADLCKANENKYHSNCWVNRPDVTPKVKQKEKPGSQVGWHPGFRIHKLKGRVLAFNVLQALQEAIEKWSNADGQVLPDSEWHVKDYYENIRSKVRSLDPSLGFCYNINGTLPLRMCNTPMKARTGFTPRANPEETSLRTIIKPTSDGYIPQVADTLLYEGPDVHNPFFDVPKGEVDVLAIIGNRRRLGIVESGSGPAKWEDMHTNREVTGRDTGWSKLDSFERKLGDPVIVGQGWQLSKDAPPGHCAGEYNDVCKRSPESDCLLYGHQDGRAGVIGNCLSGWLVMSLKSVKEGIIVIKFESWHWPEESTRTEGWTTINNEAAKNTTRRHQRFLKRPAPIIPENFIFEFAINGKVTSYNKTEFDANHMMVQRVVECITLLDDPNFTNGKEQDVEVAVRIRGCGRANVFKVTHMYWA